MLHQIIPSPGYVTVSVEMLNTPSYTELNWFASTRKSVVGASLLIIPVISGDIMLLVITVIVIPSSDIYNFPEP